VMIRLIATPAGRSPYPTTVMATLGMRQRPGDRRGTRDAARVGGAIAADPGSSKLAGDHSTSRSGAGTSGRSPAIGAAFAVVGAVETHERECGEKDPPSAARPPAL
jgi:hypothetical protein